MSLIEQILKLLLDLIIAAFTFLFEFIEALVSGVPKRSRQYNAQFVTASTILSGNSLGFCLNGKNNLSVKRSYENALIIGGTGTGKSSVVLIPSLFSMQSSFIIHDPSGELRQLSSGYLESKGYKIKVLNFAQADGSSGYNPLERARSDSDIQKISSMLVRTALGDNAKDPFWNIQSVSIISIIISLLKKQDKKYQNLYNARHLLNELGSNPEAVDRLFNRYADNALFAEYKSFIAYDTKVVSSIIATAKAALQLFSDESVARVTSFDTLDFQQFRDQQVALFVQNSVADQKYYSTLTSILFEQFFSFILGRFPLENEFDIFLLIDECASLFLPTLPLAVANVRKHRSGIMCLIQDYSQLIHNYGRYDADAIRANCFAKMYFTGQPHETTKELESLLGRFEYTGEKGEKVIRPLMTNDEIRTIKSNKAIIIGGNQRPVLTRLRPFYKSSKYRAFSKIPPALLHSEISNNQIPVLDLPFIPKGHAKNEA